jgi:uncharacterized membrane protein YcaP (DUF421 family)
MPLPTAHHARRVFDSAARLRLQVACHAGAPPAGSSRVKNLSESDMDDLLNLSMPWWHFVVRGALTYLTLLLLLRLAGKRSFGELSPFDIVVLMLVGGALRTAVIGHDESLLGPAIAVATIILLDRLITWLCAWSPHADRWIEGEAVLLARDGETIRRELLRQGISEESFARELRRHGIASIDRVGAARLEPNGKITVLSKDAVPREDPLHSRV